MGDSGENDLQIVRTNHSSRDVEGGRASTFTEDLWSVLSVSLSFATGVHISSPSHQQFLPHTSAFVELVLASVMSPQGNCRGKNHFFFT